MAALLVCVACDDGAGDGTHNEDTRAMTLDTTGGDGGDEDTGAADTGAADTGAADTGAPDTGVADTGTADTGPVINTAGCEAVFTHVCTVLDGCRSITSNPLLLGAIAACGGTVGGLNTQITSLCEGYLTDGVAQQRPLPVYLNDATPGEIETCMTSQSCSEQFIQDITAALTTLVGGDTSAMESLMATVLAGCYQP